VSEADGFLSRWARRKARVRQGLDEPAEAPRASEAPAPAAMPATGGAAVAAPKDGVPTLPDPPSAAPHEAVPLPTMDDVARLTADSDYSRFVTGGVDRGVSNAAMKKLFSDPHFNVMDGLDTYIDDYGKPDPIPESMLRLMNQSAVLGLFDDEPAADADVVADNGLVLPATPDGAAPVAMAESPLPDVPSPRAPEPAPDDDPDLRLQQDDGAGRPGAAPGTRG
jgi:hypothetical protein